MKQCPKCSERNTNDSKFCKSCGESLEDVETFSEDLSAMADDFMKRANGLLSEGTKRAREAMTAGVEKAKEAVEAGKEKVQSASSPKEIPPVKQIQPEALPQPQTSNTHDHDTPSSEQKNTPSATNEEIKCPKCGAVGCTPQYKQNVSGGGYGCCSGGLGALVLGPLGLLCGACGRSVKTQNTLVWICPKCGHEFRVFSEKQMKRMYVGHVLVVAMIGVYTIFVALFMGLAIGHNRTDHLLLLVVYWIIFAGIYAFILHISPLEKTDEQKQNLRKIAVVMGVIAFLCFLTSLIFF